jgi:hypothetical protein
VLLLSHPPSFDHAESRIWHAHVSPGQQGNELEVIGDSWASFVLCSNGKARRTCRWGYIHSRCTVAAPKLLFTRRVLALNMIKCFSPTLPDSTFNNQLQLYRNPHKFIYRQCCMRRMSSSVIDSLPSEILLQICELLQDTHKSSLVSLSETSHKVRKIAAMVLFQKVMLPIHNYDSVGESVRQLCDILGPISALDHLRTLRLCKHPSSYNKETLRYPWNWHRSEMASAEVAWTYDHAYKPVVDLLQRCPILLDLIYELEHQLAPCILAALHQHRPHCRLHLRTFCARSLMESEPDKHEFALASSPCLHSIWFSYMEPEENDYYASRSYLFIYSRLTSSCPPPCLYPVHTGIIKLLPSSESTCYSCKPTMKRSMGHSFPSLCHCFTAEFRQALFTTIYSCSRKTEFLLPNSHHV